MLVSNIEKNVTDSEIHLVIIWSYGLSQLEKILTDLQQLFIVRRHYQISWTEQNFSTNMTRFYGQNLPTGSGKEAHCGRGSFHAFIVEDLSPKYDKRLTSRGDEKVNINLFDAKTKYRGWTGGGHRVHATNNSHEASKDIWLLLHQDIDSFRNERVTTPIEIEQDLIGANGWPSLSHLFETVNRLSNYVVLRNFESLPYEYFVSEHGDIDLMTDDLNNLVYITNASKIFDQPHRVHYKVKIDGQYIPFDFRYVGDNYYDHLWQEKLLFQREFDENGFYKLNLRNYFYSIVYHALIHKAEIANDYVERIIKIGSDFGLDCNKLPDQNYLEEVLANYINLNDYQIVVPEDHSVFFNHHRTSKQPLASLKEDETASASFKTILNVIRHAKDRSTFSVELMRGITDFATEYHLSRQRHCLLRPLNIQRGERVLELGCECGVLTRYLGEIGAEVVALEPNQTQSRIASIRCEDLSNVRVIHGDLQTLDDAPAFDWILLVGQAQYDLEQLKILLKSSGGVVLAVDNKLGLKYFNGLADEASTLPFWNIQNINEKPIKPIFARKELTTLLMQHGFEHIDFWYPFPDYRFPSVMLSDIGLQDEEFAPEEMLAKSYARSSTHVEKRFFLDPLVMRELGRNGNLADFANAFLTIARLHSPTLSEAVLGVSYAVSRKPEFITETKISRDNNTISVQKSAFFPDLLRTFKVKTGNTLTQNLDKEEYIPGSLAIWPLIEVRAKGGGINEVVSALLPWFDYLMGRAVVNSTLEKALVNYRIDGIYLDSAPFNLIESNDNFFFIDREWQFENDISLGWVVTRSIVHLLIGAPGHESTPLIFGEVIKALCSVRSILVHDSDIQQWLMEESEYQFLVSGSRGFHITIDSQSRRISNAYSLPQQNGVSQHGSANSNPLDVILTLHKQTGVSILRAAETLITRKPGTFSSTLEIEQFLLQACEAVFNSFHRKVEDGSLFILSESEHRQFEKVLNLLRSGRFQTLNDSAESLLQEVLDWRQHHEYQRWINNHAMLEIDAQMHAERMVAWQDRPRFHLFMFLFTEEQNLLADTIDSLGQQFYPGWKLTVIADTAAPDVMFEELDVLEWLQFPEHEEPYAFLNRRMAASSFEWVGFIPAGTRFEPQIWLQFGDYINHYPGKTAFYCDDDLIKPDGERFQPRFKPDFNLDLLRSNDYIGPIICKRNLFEAVLGFDKVPGHENLSLALKIYERVGTKGIGHISDLLLHLPVSAPAHYSTDMSKLAVQQHLIRQQLHAVAEDGLVDNAVRVLYQWPNTPKVSIIIPTKDKLEFLRPCVEAALYRNNYPSFEVIVVNNLSEEIDTLAYLEELKVMQGVDLTVIDYPQPFNYAAISNMAAKRAKGEYLLFLNNDTEALHPEWLERMMAHGQRPEVGVVGARLVYPETGMLQHAGVIMGMTYVADHPYLGELNIREPGYMNRAQLDQNFSAVTGACLLVRKSVYDQVGGMNEIDLAVLYNDVDLCLKVRESDHLVVWTPYAVLVHHGSVSQKTEYLKPAVLEKSRSRSLSEGRYMFKTWMHYIANDPASNRHLSLAHRDLRIESEMPTNWDTTFHDRSRILGLPLSGGSGEYRVIQPFAALSQAGVAQCEHYRFIHNKIRPILISEYARIAPDTVVFQAAVNDIQLSQLEQLNDYLPDIFRVYTIDDLLTNVPEQSPAHMELKRHFYDVKTRLRKALQFSHRLIVSTQPLADLCIDMIDDICVIPNRLSKATWLSVTSLQNQGSKPRVGWAGAQQHQGDLAIMNEIVKATADEVDWIFMGMCPDEIKPYVREYHHFVPINEYPEKLASLNLDLAVAPLEIHPFNEAKSNLRLLEYGVLGWPVICTDIYPYQTNNPPVVRVKNDVDSWVTAIRQLLTDKAALADAGLALKAWVIQHYMLEDHLDEWLDALIK